ncbi:sugar phosphate isomerase/epimerase family protein [Anaerocolumna jejuensis]|uniref:sugar phosphate isomerase/epimerase family protein n=1 Tax=Anaerocolumna jejuensis TaxID=259063 RepID=UPI003F7BFD58
MAGNQIKYAVTLYSLSCEYFTGKYNLEECLKAVAEMGYKGIEIVASQMIPEYPNPSKEWMNEFVGLLKKYQLEPICYSAYIDMGIRSDRDLNEAEIFQCTLNDMMYASYMGFPILRTQHAITPKIFEKMVPYARKLNIKLTIELHRPHTPSVPVWQEYMRIIDKYGTEYLGIVPDFSIFQRTPHKLYLELAIKQGAREEVLQTACRVFDQGGDVEDAIKQIDCPSEFETMTLEDIYSNFYSNSADVEEMKVLLKYAPYIHGKFYYLEENKDDTCIPFNKLLPIIKEAGYSGYISSEYEGHHFTTDISSAEQLHRLIKMENRILNSI